MSNISINDLPIELLIEIFKRVDDQRSLKVAALVCKLWNTTIQSSMSWSVATRLDKQSSEFLMTTNRKINKIKIDNFCHDKIEDAISILKRHGSRVVHFTLSDSNFHVMEHFSGMLKLLSNLEELVLLGTKVWPVASVPSIAPSADDMPNMVKLKTFQMFASDYRFVKYLRHSELNTIKIRNYDFEKEPLVDLLRFQPHLKRLSLDICTHDFFYENMPFQLTHLALLRMDCSSNGYRNVLKFIRAQISTIKGLALTPFVESEIPDFIYELVFENANNLKYIWLDVGDFPENINSYNQMWSNITMKNCIFKNTKGLHSCPTWFTGFNITELTLHETWCEESISSIASNFKKLEKLTVDRFYDIAGLQFPKMSCLTIKKFEGSSKLWKQFIKGNSQITELNIHLLHGFNMKASHFVQQTTTILKLRTLRISEHFEEDKHFFDVIRKNCSNLEILDLRRGCFTQSQSELNDITGLRFHDHSLNFRSNELDFFYYGDVYANEHLESVEDSDVESLQDSMEEIDKLLADKAKA